MSLFSVTSSIRGQVSPVNHISSPRSYVSSAALPRTPGILASNFSARAAILLSLSNVSDKSFRAFSKSWMRLS